MFTLYYSPAACSLAVHIALEEAGIPHHLERRSTREGETRRQEYLAVNPLGQVPALRLPDGRVLTEVAALLGYIADQVPDRALLPTAPLERAVAQGWMSLFATSVHGAFRNVVRPELCASEASACKDVVETSRARYFSLLRYVESRLVPRAWLLGERHSLCDGYAFCFFLWGQVFEWPVHELPRYRALARRVRERDATERALVAEGFVGQRRLAIA